VRRKAKTRRVETATPVVAAVALAALSLLVVAPASGYDAWMWLLWGREVSEATLSTVDGPAFKPLPVAAGALLAPLGGLAPVAWVLLVRGAAVAAAWLAFRLAGWLGALAVLLCGGLAAATASGAEPALVVALALGAAACWRDGRPGWALALGAGCALLRVEAWPFLLAAGVVAWRRRPELRPALAALAVAIPAAWLVPEWLGSGDALRSGTRARVPNPGQPALADVPALASLRAAAALPLWPLWLGVAVVAVRRDRRGLELAAAGAAWCLLVALMAQAGFSGEPRYALPGAALIALAGARGANALIAAAGTRAAGPAGAVAPIAAAGGRGAATPIAAAGPATPIAGPYAAARIAVALLAAALLAAAVPRVADLADVRAAQAHQWALQRDLGTAIERAGGRERVLACGTPFAGPYRGPLLAHALHVRKRDVEPDAAPRAPGVAFRSRLRAGGPVAPAAPPWPIAARTGSWEVRASCRS
jgi:hypothetical protein